MGLLIGTWKTHYRLYVWQRPPYTKDYCIHYSQYKGKSEMEKKI